MIIYCDLQYSTDDLLDKQLPTEQKVIQWLTPVLTDTNLYHSDIAELCIRFVDELEMITLNNSYRKQNKVTNVLSFPFEQIELLPEPLNLLGDIVLCCSVIEKEAREQEKSIESHYAHLIIHGCLHLLGFDHIETDEALEMETLETKFMIDLGWRDPYINE